MKRTRADKISEQQDALMISATQPPSDFGNNGSWNPKVQAPIDRDPTRHLYWFTDMLITRRRRTPAAKPALYAARIAASPFGEAFPSQNDWLVAETWVEAPAVTSAEAAVRHCGRGPWGQRCSHGQEFAGPSENNDVPKGQL